MALTKATQNVLEGIVSTGSTGISAGLFIVAQQYKITSLGTTTQLEWNTIAGTTGQTYVVGSLFTAATNGASSGTGAAAVARTLANRFADVVNVLDFGADPTGVVDSTTFIQDAISSLGANGGIVYLPEGTYKCTSRINVANKTTIYGYGATLNFETGDNDKRLSVSGTIGSDVSLTANAITGDKSITVSSSSGLVAGDLILISSNKLVPLASIGGITTQKIGEFAIIRNISGTTINIDGALDDTYNTSDSAKIQKVTPHQDVSIFGLNIIGKGPTGSDTSTSDIGIGATYCKKLTIRDCTITRCDYQAISISQCYIVNIDNNSTLQAYRGNDSFLNVIQYGIAIKGASSIIYVENNSFTGGKHGIAWTENVLPGVGRNCVIHSNTVNGTWSAAIATHESNEQFTITSNYIAGCARGMDIRVRRGIIANNSIRNIGNTTGDGIYLSLTASDLVIESNALYEMRYGIRMYDPGLPSGAKPYNVKIINNVISDISQIGIYLEQTQNTGNFRNWVIDGNTIRECLGDSIRLNGAFYSPTISNNVIKNFVTGSGYGVKLMGTTRAQIHGNYFENMIPIRLENDGQTPAVQPEYSTIINNIWDKDSGLVSVSSGADYTIRSNIQTGVTTNPVIASGAITIPSGVATITVDTEGSSATDDLTSINGGTTGDIVVFRSASSFRDITFKDAVGNLSLAGDFILDNVNDRISLIRSGTGWDEISRSNNT